MKYNISKDLVCPSDHFPLKINNIGKYICSHCKTNYKVRDNIPIFFSDKEWDDLYLNDGGNHYATNIPFELVEGDQGYISHISDEDYGTVLDLGCGDGVFSSKLDKKHKVYCVDVTLSGLKRLKKRNKTNLIPVLGSGYSLPFPNNFFKTILYIFVVEHLSQGNDLRMLSEIHRVLSHDGKVVYTTDTPFFDKYIVKWSNLFLRLKWIKQDHSSPTGHINLLTMSESRKLIKNASFEIVEEYPYIMGQRFKLWNSFVNALYKILPTKIIEDYFTSKYVFVLRKLV